ncbi:MAG: peptidoglycan binding domain-containing protein, partial [Chloroflexota bacterium]|nr:peptidoglycan binding domain-containing protein [Chloroflexota bacterium]
MSTPLRVAGTRLRWDPATRKDPFSSLSLERVSRVATLLLKAVATFVVACILGLALYGWDHSDRLYEGVRAGGVNVGGLSEEVAAARIDAEFAAYLETPIQLTAGDLKFEVTPKQVGVRLDSAGTAQDAFASGRSGSYWRRTQVWVGAFLHGQDLPLRITLDSDLFAAELARIAPEVVVAPANAVIAMNVNDSPTLLEDQPGVSLE